MNKLFMKIVSSIVGLLFVFQTTAFSAEEIFFYHTDPAGTPLAMSDMSGKKVWEADYKPFGEEYSVDGSEGNSKRFVGKEKDEETGLDYFGARYLSPENGRFLAPDPVRAVDARTGQINLALLTEPQRQNVYAYSLNNPYRYVDDDGKFAWVLAAPALCAGGGCEGLAGALTGIAIALGFKVAYDKTSDNAEQGSENSDNKNNSGGQDNSRKKNVQKGESGFWKNLKPYKDGTKTNGQGGKEKRFYEWDHTHNDIEVYDSKKKHIGSADPKTGKIYKPPVKGRKLKDK